MMARVCVTTTMKLWLGHSVYISAHSQTIKTAGSHDKYAFPAFRIVSCSPISVYEHVVEHAGCVTGCMS